MTALAVAVGGGLGALARYLAEGLVTSRQRSLFPWSTLIVNVSGSAALAAFVGAALSGATSGAWFPFVVTGMFGGYTTFSTFVYENLRLFEQGAWRPAACNILAMGPASFAAAATAYLLAS